MHAPPPSREPEPRGRPGARAGSGFAEPRPTLGDRVRDLRDRAAGALERVPRPWLLGAVAVVLLVVVAALASFGPLVRGRVAKEAAKRRLEITVGAVRPGFFAIGLEDVRVRLQGVEGLDVRLEHVRVELTASLSPREVAAKGGAVTVDGEPEDVVERLRTFQKNGKTEGSAPAAGPRVPLSAKELALAWKMPSGGEITGSGLEVARDEGGTQLGCGRIAASVQRSTLEVLGGVVDLAPDGAVRHVTAASVTVGRELAPGKPAAAALPGSAAEPVPPPLPAAAPRDLRAGKKGRAKVVAAAAPAAAPVSDEPVLPLPDLHALRARIAGLAQAFLARVPDGSKFDIGGLAVKLDIGGEPFAFGPGPFTMNRQGDVVRLSFASEKGGAAQSTPLAIEAELPLGQGDVSAHLSGGPVSLGMLGVKEGTKGLFDVAKGTVSGKGLLVLAAAGDGLTFDGQIALAQISIKQPRLSAEPLRGLDLAISARGLLNDGGLLRVDDAQLDMGALHVRTHGTLEESADHFGLALAVDIAPASCQALLDSTPQGLLPTVRSARMGGTFGATSRVVFDTRSIDKLVLDYAVDDRCRLVEVPPDLSRDRFSSSFTYRTYHPDGTPSETTTGPGTSAWSDLDSISPYMMAAVLTTEDGAFYKHHGFNHNAIKSSVAANLKARRFVRGASTITMQLSKNLFLSREKTLSRKLEEIILTDYLEQEFRKDDMMELYLNVIEFGPDVYGVTRAAEHYFGRKPDELNEAECFFLASIMPSPNRYGKMRDKGQISEGWQSHLAKLMEIAAKNHKLSSAELAEGLAQTVTFYRPGDPRPEPRRPVINNRRDAYEEDAGWQPLD
ncbi:MAG: Monofunctional biosynthetic peptidoglycan transglycosylase [Labilithrix sp.]|nr:Monofunctional biosynthetic peptidoglycan transglycosylase [Labilithrix sp.]